VTSRPCILCSRPARTAKHRVWICGRCLSEAEREAVRVALVAVRRDLRQRSVEQYGPTS
jgi:hypothetical protein